MAYDNCIHCPECGDIRTCQKVECSLHESWYTQALREQNAKLLEALKDMVDVYVSLINSGDAGFWNPEKEDAVIKSRAAIAKAEGKE